ncbi:MAG TPA: tRNA (adenosine(37)-N6)-threonylcarbamoyltransferase complex ATPase subunit type 1 TsaE [Verrucomicrobiae bacterium]|nr:tRNA (adenosine(37)-N6)-threonylcarbamoyltransferase complex ATPase subunit type 1 TsaE [Verrucomicrobiae bacterium]
MAKPLGLPMERTFSSQADFEAFAGAFAAELRPGDVVGLSGALGAGKTTFVRACVRALQGTDPTSSPTFTFWHRYPGPPPIDHLDLYRVEGPDDLTELGLEQAFDGTSIVLIEWWTNAPGLLPLRRYELEISGAGDRARRVTVRPPA